MSIALLVYGVGILVGLSVMRDRFVPRLVTALLWPVGPLTGGLVVVGLMIVAAVLWPMPMLLAAALLGTALYLAV